jgi:hypothetical protein
VELEKLEKYHRYYEEKGEVGVFLDLFRPNWTPSLPLWQMQTADRRLPRALRLFELFMVAGGDGSIGEKSGAGR